MWFMQFRLLWGYLIRLQWIVTSYNSAWPCEAEVFQQVTASIGWVLEASQVIWQCKCCSVISWRVSHLLSACPQYWIISCIKASPIFGSWGHMVMRSQSAGSRPKVLTDQCLIDTIIMHMWNVAVNDTDRWHICCLWWLWVEALVCYAAYG